PALEGGVTLSEALVDVGWALLQGGAILVPVIALAIYVVPWIVEKIAYTRDVELFLLVALAFGLGTGLLTAQLGLSPAMGAFLAGLIISESEYVHETLARILPLRDLFVALFFVSVGLLIDPTAIVAHWPLVLGIVGLVVVGKGLLRGGLAALFAQPLRISFFMALGFTQIGEFTFVMAQVGADNGVLSDANYNVLLASALLTIIVSSSLFRATPALWRRVSARFPEMDWPQPPQNVESTHPTDTSGHGILCGYGRIGGTVADALIRFGVPFVVVERDPGKADLLKAREVPVVIGDAAHETVLREAAPERASLVVIALPDFYNARQAFRTLRAFSAELPIVARAHWGPEREQFFREGITDVVQPEFEGAIEMVRHTLMHADVASLEVEGYIRETRQQRYGRLVQSWLQREDPGHRTHKLQEVPLSEGSPLAGQSLAGCQVREHFGVSVLAIRRRSGELVSNPSPDTVFQVGDRVLVMGTPTQMIEFAEMSRGSD
ncbi:MAG: cation:proton antiporter, partial [Candidatus Bipolaricaulia bacterium]